MAPSQMTYGEIVNEISPLSNNSADHDLVFARRILAARDAQWNALISGRAGEAVAWQSTMRELLNHIERHTCMHEDTYRGGLIWEICRECGAKWADDEGGKPEFKVPVYVDRAHDLLASPPAPQEAQADTCETCNGHGMIGGPSYYSPDEGGVPCPDCAAPVAQPATEQAEARHIANGADLEWQAKIFHEEMDKLGVPRDDGEDFYSLIGRANLALATQPMASNAKREVDKKVPFQFDYLAEFYKADTVPELIAAQAYHIEKLQNTVREHGLLLPAAIRAATRPTASNAGERELIAEALKIQADTFGNGTKLHLAMIDWAKKACAALASKPTQGEQKPAAVVRSIAGAGLDGVRLTWLSGFPQIGMRLYTAPQPEPVAPPAHAALLRDCAAYLSELYAKYQTRVGPFASQAQLLNARIGAALSATPPAQAVQDKEDAERWRMLPAFIQDHQIDYVKLLSDIDTERAARTRGNGVEPS